METSDEKVVNHIKDANDYIRKQSGADVLLLNVGDGFTMTMKH